MSEQPRNWDRELADILGVDETAVRENRVDFQQAGRMLRFYEDGLQGYTYLEDAHDG